MFCLCVLEGGLKRGIGLFFQTQKGEGGGGYGRRGGGLSSTEFLFDTCTSFDMVIIDFNVPDFPIQHLKLTTHSLYNAMNQRNISDICMGLL